MPLSYAELEEFYESLVARAAAGGLSAPSPAAWRAWLSG